MAQQYNIPMVPVRLEMEGQNGIVRAANVMLPSSLRYYDLPPVNNEVLQGPSQGCENRLVLNLIHKNRYW